MKNKPQNTNKLPLSHIAWWSAPASEIFNRLRTDAHGLSAQAAAKRLRRLGYNRIEQRTLVQPLRLLLRQFQSPLVLMLLFAAVISIITGEWLDASIVLAIVLSGALLGFIQEYNAGNAIEQLRKRITLRSVVWRNGKRVNLAAEEIVPGDIVELSAGSLIPADGLLLNADDFFVNQAVLTGETFPVEKKPGIVPAQSEWIDRTNCVLMGTSVRSGLATMVVTATGQHTAYGQIAAKLNLRPPETEFERGIRRFGAMLTQVMTLLVLLVFAINVILHKPAVDALLFAVALAVGLTPELLPAIISITLSRGATQMAKAGVIVRQLTALENFGSMDILCTDKTGTLTMGIVQLDGALDTVGKASDTVFLSAYLNARLQSGLQNPLDEAIINYSQPDISEYQKTEEIPYDFVRKRLSIAVRKSSDKNSIFDLLITKGAFDSLLEVCSFYKTSYQEEKILDEGEKARLEQLYEKYSKQGFRVLGLAEKRVARRAEYTSADETDMTFCGLLLFFDPPKAEVTAAINQLREMGVSLKIVTGDNRYVAAHIAEKVNLGIEGILTGAQINQLHDEALWHTAELTNIFAEVDPNQKERIITALQKTGHVVGYLGDGINDAPALHAADVGISVDNAVDVAKETADLVLLQHDLNVLAQGIALGRTTFANTLKYVFTTTSANFGNMLSMAGLSLFVPFLPLLPKQILLNNFLSDFPAMTIAGDAVDPEFTSKPQRWRMDFIRNFMLLFGLISSLFDYLTFGLLLLVIKVQEAEFRTAWFIESLLTELVILLIVRTRRLAFKSRPSLALWLSSVAVALVAIIIPYWPGIAQALGFVPLPLEIILMIIGITVLYAISNEIAKYYFFKKSQ